MKDEFWNKDELIRLAAEGCYYYKKDRRRRAMGIVIEMLVLPKDFGEGSKEDLSKYIRQALEELAE